MSPTGSARQRSPTIPPSISPDGFASTGRTVASGWTPAIGCCGRSAETTPCADHFGLGVNYVGSLVNRHRIELYILDAQARIAASFERLRWDEREVVAKAVEVLKIA